MEDLLISTLKMLGYPVKRQGSLLEDAPYPNHFFTFWNDSADGQSFYSNTEGSIVWMYSVNFYSVDPELVATKLLEAKELLNDVGFNVTGAGYDVMSDEPTHTGRGITAYFMEVKKHED